MVFAPALRNPPCAVVGHSTNHREGNNRDSRPSDHWHTIQRSARKGLFPRDILHCAGRPVHRDHNSIAHRSPALPTPSASTTSIRDTNSSGHLGASECRQSQQQCRRAPRGSGPSSGGVCKKTIRTQVVSTLVGREEHREHQVVLRQKPRALGTTGPGKTGHCQWWLCLSPVRSGVCSEDAIHRTRALVWCANLR
ncbi:hypothetical protein BDP55DRAFT_433429 [Colletotrichum godetiae]|uniref:Uncharacterized protein n=1 Tax=Colletotrichum godetiae TaxID=1209918 RepID=A0AAJ0ATA5_9PEZI|nr:uncharacterized protein BDP55DRAFT_433429 [Colletotrichum godetiae]KAK1689237.1 hypothetical protein BDP55DRAFT_433429 [Colletotrichum godetiae]